MSFLTANKLQSAASTAPSRRPATRSSAAATYCRSVPEQRQPASAPRAQPEHQQRQQHGQTVASSSRRSALLAGLAAAAFLGSPGRGFAAGGGGERQANALEEYMQQESKGKLKDRKALDDFRWDVQDYASERHNHQLQLQ